MDKQSTRHRTRQEQRREEQRRREDERLHAARAKRITTFVIVGVVAQSQTPANSRIHR
jgi:hypothetical protein